MQVEHDKFHPQYWYKQARSQNARPTPTSLDGIVGVYAAFYTSDMVYHPDWTQQVVPAADKRYGPVVHTGGVAYTLFTLRKPRSPLLINGERGFVRVNQL